MDKLLLLMPKFMGYEKSLIENLQKQYDVTWVDCDKFDKEILLRYKKCSKIRWGIRRLFSMVKKCDIECAENYFLDKELEQISVQQNFYSVVFCINGAYLSDEFYIILKRRNPHAKYIFYAWDDANNLIKQSHINFFERVYSYNIEECKKNGWEYLPMFVQSEKKGHDKKDKYDIVFIGSAHSDRRKIASDLLYKYSDKYKIFIYLYDPNHTNDRFCYDEPLPYNVYLDMMMTSKALLDIPQMTQKGPTTRFFDALLTETKVITTNINIKNYPIYSSNILLTERNDIIIDDDFMNKPYQKNEYKPLGIHEWLLKLGV